MTINVIAAKVFEMIAGFEKASTKNDETASIFMKLTFLHGAVLPLLRFKFRREFQDRVYAFLRALIDCQHLAVRP